MLIQEVFFAEKTLKSVVIERDYEWCDMSLSSLFQHIFNLQDVKKARYQAKHKYW